MQEYIILIFSWIVGFALVSYVSLNGLRKIGDAVRGLIPIPVRVKNR